MTPVTADSAPSTSNQLDFANGDSANVASFENAQLEQHTNRLLSAADPLSQSQGYHRLNYHHAPALASQPISEPGSTPGTSGVVSLDQQYFQSEVLHERFLANCEKLPGRMNRFEVLGDQTQAEMCEEYSQLGDGMEVDSGPLRTSQSSEMPEGKGSEQFPPYVKAMMKKLESMSYAIQQQTKTNSKLADNLGMLVEKFARMEERMNAVQAENVNLLEILDGMQEKIKALENKPATNIPAPRQTTYASVVNSGLPPRPVPDNTTTSGNNTTTRGNKNDKGKDPKNNKILKPLYPRAAREVIVTFAEMPTTKDTQPIEDKALKLVNTALLTSDLKKRAFCGARFSLALNLVLTTGLHDNNAELGEFLPVIVKALEFIGPCTAKLSEPWTKFLLHGVPTDANLEDIREDVERYCPNIQLGQTPRWLANAENRKNKSHSTVVLAFLGSVTTSDLGGREIRVENRSCTITPYIPYGPQIQCFRCQQFGHPKERCNADPVCAVCAGPHLTQKHECPENICKGGYPCFHPFTKCAVCSGPHRASNRACPVRIKISQEFRQLCILRRTAQVPPPLAG
jgi:hypothetical protein